MRRMFLLVLFSCHGLLRAQSPTPPVPAPVPADPVSLASYQMQMFTRSLEDGTQEAAQRKARAQAEETARLEFCRKANRFVELWSNLAEKMNSSQVFDVKLAKQVSKAFHDLEKSDGWPVSKQSSNLQTTH